MNKTMLTTALLSVLALTACGGASKPTGPVQSSTTGGSTGGGGGSTGGGGGGGGGTGYAVPHHQP